MANTRRRKGFGRERMLARKLWEKGFAVLRAPASGAKARRLKYPDMVVLRNGHIIVLEIKTSEKQAPIYIPRQQVEKIREFARRAGGKAYIAVDYIGTGMGWRFIPIEELAETKRGNYRIDPDKAKNSPRIQDLIRATDKARPLDRWIQ